MASVGNEKKTANQPQSIWSKKGPMAVTVIALLIDLIGFTIILPLFPSILNYYKENDPSGWYQSFAEFCRKLGKMIGAPSNQSETVLMGGLLGSMFSLLQFLSAPILGAYSDVYGRKKALLICMVGIIGSHLLWLFSTTFPVFILSRILGGLSRANVSISTTIVSDDCPDALRPKGMAMIGIAFSIGFIVGPGIGGYFARSGNFSVPAAACVGLSTVSFLILLLFLEETLDAKYAGKGTLFDKRKIVSYIWPADLFRFQSVSVGPQLKPVGIAYFIYIFIYSGLEFTLTFLTQAKLNFSSMEQAKMFTMLGLTMIIFQGTLTRRMKPNMVDSAAMAGMWFMIPAFLVLGLCRDCTQLGSGLFCYSIGSAICGPMLTSMASSRVTKMNELGTALGIFRSLGALARGFGPIVASSLFWCFGPEKAYTIGGVAMILPIYLTYRAANPPVSANRNATINASKKLD